MAKTNQPKGGNTVQAVERLVTPVLESLGLRLWDVRFEKEGPDWFLRIFIDRDTPLDMQACEDATRAINPIIDEADPISQSYYMEVGGPGLGRRLTKEMHFTTKIGQKIEVHFYRADENGQKELSGILTEKQPDTLTLTLADDTQTTLQMKDISFAKLCDDEDLF